LTERAPKRHGAIFCLCTTKSLTHCLGYPSLASIPPFSTLIRLLNTQGFYPAQCPTKAASTRLYFRANFIPFLPIKRDTDIFAMATMSGLSASVTRILYLTGFPKELKTKDIQSAFSEYENNNGGFKIKWKDDTSLLIVFQDAAVGESFVPLRWSIGSVTLQCH
jgi:hypothetical protein